MIDTHCHLDFRQYDGDRAQVIEGSLEELRAMVNVGAGLKASREAVAMADSYNGLFASVGLHPQDTEPDLEIDPDEQLDQLENLIKTSLISWKSQQKESTSPSVVAVGEVGLDYSPPPEERERGIEEQKRLFRKQIALAKEYDLPLVVHSRDSFDDTLGIMKENRVERAVFHCFTYGVKEARKVLDSGYLVSFTGIVTFRKARGVQETAAYVPLDRLMVETDAPFLAPEPHRGKRCEPWMVKYVAEKIAGLKGRDLTLVEEIIDQNAVSFFSLFLT